LSSDDTYTALFELGSAQVLDAIPVIERFLTHANPDFRRLALQSLVFDYHLQRHWETARQMLHRDPDVDVRMMAAAALGRLRRSTQDRVTLRILANLVRDEDEDTFVRQDAYDAMLSVLQPDSWPRFGMLRTIDLDTNVDWDMVDFYLAEPESPERTQ
jgi:HEAT repeat protein